MAFRLNGIWLKRKEIFTFFKKNLSSDSNDKSAHDTVSNLLSTRPVGSVRNVKGWVGTLRKMKDSLFIDVLDGSCCNVIQVIYPKSKRPEGLEYGASVNVIGKVQLALNGHQLEIVADSIDIIGTCSPAGKSGKLAAKEDYPFIPKQKHALEYLREYLHLRLQTKFFTSLLRIRSEATLGVYNFFSEKGFINVHTPIITSNDCEGACEIFKVQPADDKLLAEMKKEDVPIEQAFFDSNAYLTVSGQLHLEAAARRFHKVYTFNPTFRAENSNSRQHLSEFYMIEAEQGFVNSIEDILSTMEGLVKSLLTGAISRSAEDIEYILKYNEIDVDQHFKMIETIIKKPFIVMTYSEAVNVLEKKLKLEGANDGLTRAHELALVKYHDNVPVFVINWPKKIKPFYMKETDGDPNLVSGVDLLVPNVGELCGGSLREDNYDKLKLKLKNLKLLQSLKWYLELRKFGNVPTGGFGLGFERYLQLLLNIINIRDTIPFPRSPHNLKH